METNSRIDPEQEPENDLLSKYAGQASEQDETKPGVSLTDDERAAYDTLLEPEPSLLETLIEEVDTKLPGEENHEPI